VRRAGALRGYQPKSRLVVAESIDGVAFHDVTQRNIPQETFDTEVRPRDGLTVGILR
jgi:hypothetical protein